MFKILIKKIAFLFILCGCSTSVKKEAKEKLDVANLEKSDYLINFKKIDNYAEVYIEDSLIYTSPLVHGNPEVDYLFDFSTFIKDESETLTIKLFNGEAPFHYQEDPHWEVRYYLIINGEIVDFIHEVGNDNSLGKVFEYTYIVNEWLEP